MEQNGDFYIQGACHFSYASIASVRHHWLHCGLLQDKERATQSCCQQWTIQNAQGAADEKSEEHGLVRIGVKYHQVWKRKRHVLFKSFFNAGLQIYFQGSCQKGTPLFPPDHYKCLINLSIHVADFAWFFTRDPSLIWNTVMDLTDVSFDFIWKAIWVFYKLINKWADW